MNARLTGEIIDITDTFTVQCGDKTFECFIHGSCIGKTNIKIGKKVIVEGYFINNGILETYYVRKAYAKRRGQR